jgi:hypothetical protein
VAGGVSIKGVRWVPLSPLCAFWSFLLTSWNGLTICPHRGWHLPASRTMSQVNLSCPRLLAVVFLLEVQKTDQGQGCRCQELVSSPTECSIPACPDGHLWRTLSLPGSGSQKAAMETQVRFCVDKGSRFVG